MPTTVDILRALANEFALRMEVSDNQFVFFNKEEKDESLVGNERASLEISLNNKN